MCNFLQQISTKGIRERGFILYPDITEVARQINLEVEDEGQLNISHCFKGDLSNHVELIIIFVFRGMP
jgi:hypothetical protein